MPRIEKCRICESAQIVPILKLGETPPANSFVKPQEAKGQECFPLELFMCKECFLVQLGYTVPPEVLFKNYLYFSSMSETLKSHFAALAREIMEKFTHEGEIVVEIGSNDGVFLRNFVGRKVRGIGFEPATNVAKVAREAGVETINDFFNLQNAEKFISENGHAKVIVATNVFAHVAGLRDLVEGMERLLGKDGVVIIEFHHLASLYGHMEFDSIYHEHLCYYLLKPLHTLFGFYGMEIFDVEKIPIHGGSLRIYVQKKGGEREISATIGEIVAQEEGLGLYRLETYEKFAGKISKVKEELVGLLTKLKEDGKVVAGYGAPAKCTTLLNYCGIGPSLLSYIVDKGPSKQNLLVPGVGIPIYGPQMLKEKKPDYLLILAWNLYDEIVKQQAQFRMEGGKFIVPIPEPRII